MIPPCAAVPQGKCYSTVIHHTAGHPFALFTDMELKSLIHGLISDVGIFAINKWCRYHHKSLLTLLNPRKGKTWRQIFFPLFLGKLDLLVCNSFTKTLRNDSLKCNSDVEIE